MKNTEQSLRKNLKVGIIICMSLICICLSILFLMPNEAKPYYSVSAEERELLARLVHCEASTESQECRMAVASAVFNRLDAGYWGDTLYDVIHYPYAFTPVLYNALYDWEVDERDYEAVDYVIWNGPTIPTYVRYFRADYDHQWEDYANYCILDTTYFGYFINWERGEW